jgi:hypothetical protein
MPAERERLDTHTPPIQAAVEELQRLIHGIYPSATFQVVPGDDPAGTYLVATVDIEDVETVIDVYIERLLALQIDHGLPVYVVPMRPPTRVSVP